jgi:predicted regulator of Ras-like GTPase activity (Roadblock/LC7/MglB family)
MNEPSVIDRLELTLHEIRKIGDIEASAIASRDGLLICSTLSDQRHAEKFVALLATMVGAAETASSELGNGIPELIIIESKTGKTIGTGAGPRALLFVLTRPGASLGLVLIEVKKASEKIKMILG